jgi:hypothetical protein
MNNTLFNEVEYLAANPDVALPVEQGAFISGYKHYVEYGKSEGRALKGLPSSALRE